MVLKQATIYGGYKVVGKNNHKKKPKKIKPAILKQKLEILYKLYEQLYNRFNISILEQRDVIIINDIILYPEDRQAEPIELLELTIYDIDERIKKMKEVLDE